MISYAQNFEDVLLNRVFDGRASGFYIDVGAMDPVDGSVTKTFYDRGWCGINIEPDPRFYKRLVAERPRDVNLPVGLGERVGDLPFYRFEDQGISTLSTHYRDHFAERGRPWSEVTLAVRTLADVCREYVRQPIDFLKIDAEGWEGPILRGGAWQTFRPTVLVIEATEPFSHTPAWQDWEPFLTGSCGYEFVYFDGLNRFYLRQESSESRPAFAYPPNVLDGFCPYATVQAQQLMHERVAKLQGVLRRQASRIRMLVEDRRQLQAEAESLRREVSRLEEEKLALGAELRKSRQWIGRLSEELAAMHDGSRHAEGKS